MTETERRQIIALVKSEVIPAIGCTEPIAVALCVAKAAEVLNKRPEKITVLLSANILKNAMGVGIFLQYESMSFVFYHFFSRNCFNKICRRDSAIFQFLQYFCFPDNIAILNIRLVFFQKISITAIINSKTICSSYRKFSVRST